MLGMEFWLPKLNGPGIWTIETRIGIAQTVRVRSGASLYNSVIQAAPYVL
jgi:hypothetical protein